MGQRAGNRDFERLGSTALANLSCTRSLSHSRGFVKASGAAGDARLAASKLPALHAVPRQQPLHRGKGPRHDRACMGHTDLDGCAATVLLMLLTEFMRRHYRTSMWVWGVARHHSAVIANIPGDDWFRWAKPSVILPLIFAGLAHRRRGAEGHAAPAHHAQALGWALLASCQPTSPRPGWARRADGQHDERARRLHPVRHHAPGEKALEARHLEPRRDPVLHRAPCGTSCTTTWNALQYAERRVFAFDLLHPGGGRAVPIVMRRTEPHRSAITPAR